MYFVLILVAGDVGVGGIAAAAAAAVLCYYYCCSASTCTVVVAAAAAVALDFDLFHCWYFPALRTHDYQMTSHSPQLREAFSSKAKQKTFPARAFLERPELEPAAEKPDEGDPPKVA